MHSVLGESRLFLLVSLKRASVLLFMFCIAYVWYMDESFPYYIIENVIWVTENSLTNLYAELCSWGLLCTSLFVFEIFKQIWGDLSYGRVCVCVCVLGGRGKRLWHLWCIILWKHQEEYHNVQFCHLKLTLTGMFSVVLRYT
jgi:hypothetical protein